ncbi:MAG TPA: 4-hydroxy-tetrahydrodipicolinate synthase [Saprospiraceae bacterium]|nr:4-hydroxy-tetrahydrodipicolinate synthase [Saprospiraceae bacterium]
MTHRKFIGTGVAMITPFNDRKVDFGALEKIIEYTIGGGVDYLVMLGSTGETATLNDAEARSILDFTINQVKGRKPVVAGNFGMNNTQELVKLINSYNFDGIDAILSSSPAYVKPSQEGIYRHYMEMQEVSPVPIILYNVPGRTRSNMEWSTTIRLAKGSEKFAGIKEASGDLIQTTRIIKNKPENFFVTSGDDEVALPMIACGGDGVISVMANVLPGPFSQMIHYALKNDYVRARALNEKTYDLHHWLYVEGNPVGIKAAMEILGFCSHEVRLPLSPMSQHNYDELKNVLLEVMS